MVGDLPAVLFPPGSGREKRPRKSAPIYRTQQEKGRMEEAEQEKLKEKLKDLMVAERAPDAL